MELTVTADWTQPTATVRRIDIAGYTGTIAQRPWTQLNGTDITAYEYTVLHDHREIVEVGIRLDSFAAELTVERIIAEHLAGLSAPQGDEIATGTR